MITPTLNNSHKPQQLVPTVGPCEDLICRVQWLETSEFGGSEAQEEVIHVADVQPITQASLTWKIQIMWVMVRSRKEVRQEGA
jgi:hypothetical protein